MSSPETRARLFAPRWRIAGERLPIRRERADAPFETNEPRVQSEQRLDAVLRTLVRAEIAPGQIEKTGTRITRKKRPQNRPEEINDNLGKCRKPFQKRGLSWCGALWRARENGASEGIRTLDVHLGKVMLYQTELRSLPKSVDEKLGELSWIARPVFEDFRFQPAVRPMPLKP